jgi:hypothetical protein
MRRSSCAAVDGKMVVLIKGRDQRPIGQRRFILPNSA